MSSLSHARGSSQGNYFLRNPIDFEFHRKRQNIRKYERLAEGHLLVKPRSNSVVV